MNQYEAMFLFDPTFGASVEDCEAEIKRLLDRAEAEIVFSRRWDERRLAYRIDGRKRGVYVLVYFKSAPDKIGALERDAHIAENILRLLVVRADGVTPEMMERAVSGRAAESSGSDREWGPRSRDRGSDRGRGGRDADRAGKPADKAVKGADKSGDKADKADKADKDTGKEIDKGGKDRDKGEKPATVAAAVAKAPEPAAEPQAKSSEDASK